MARTGPLSGSDVCADTTRSRKVGSVGTGHSLLQTSTFGPPAFVELADVPEPSGAARSGQAPDTCLPAADRGHPRRGRRLARRQSSSRSTKAAGSSAALP